MTTLEARYRRALRWYPRKWRRANEGAIVGTLLDSAGGDGRTVPARGELANLRLNSIRVRVKVVGGAIPMAVRGRAAAACLGLGAAISIAGLARIAASAELVSKHGSIGLVQALAEIGVAGVPNFVLWPSAAIAGLVGFPRVSRWLVAVSMLLLLGAWILGTRAPQLISVSTATFAVFTLLGIIIVTTNTDRHRAHRVTIAVGLAISLTASALVGLNSFASLINQRPLEALDDLLGGGGGFYLDDNTIWWDRDILLRPFQTWFVIAIPVLIVAAGILNRRGLPAWAGALLLVLLPMSVTLVIAGRTVSAVIGTLEICALAAVIIVGTILMLRVFGIRIRVTRI